MKTSYAGLGDVAGGRMWYVCTKEKGGIRWFGRKAEAMKFARLQWGSGSSVVKELRGTKGRTCFYV